MHTEERDFRTNRTLTERVARLEKFVRLNGIDEPMQDEGDLATGDYDISLNWDAARALSDEPASALDEVMQRISASTSRVRRTTEILEEIGNRILGMPEEGSNGKGGTEAMPSGTLEQTRITLNRLDYSLARLEAAAARLERV